MFIRFNRVAFSFSTKKPEGQKLGFVPLFKGELTTVGRRGSLFSAMSEWKDKPRPRLGRLSVDFSSHRRSGARDAFLSEWSLVAFVFKETKRYLQGVGRVTWAMRAWTHDEMQVDVRVDPDWANGHERKPTSGGMMMMNGTVVKYWSRAQATRALSTAKAEYYAVSTGAAEALGMQSMMTDLGLSTQVRVWTDSNAAMTITSRRGLGKTRHVELKHLWLQEVTNGGPGHQNVADHLTKGQIVARER